MAASPYNPAGDYQPDSTIATPPLYLWPPQPMAALKWLFFGMLFPWGHLFIGLAFVSWYLLTPALATMAEFEPGWIALIWLRNAVLLTLIVGGLHWWLYMRRSQERQYKFHDKWLATGNESFLWGDQVKDNMFWCIVSGVSFWTFYEVITYWIYANGMVSIPAIAEHPIYFVFGLLAVFFWSTIHFYFVHRLLHWQPIYKVAHELHHRNVNTGPWTGISMHPLEHVVYFSLFVLWWFVPVHPVIIVLTGLFQAISPAFSHSGFDYIRITRNFRVSTGDWYHQLHHQYFNFNYGNTTTPFDKLFGSWHDGSRESLLQQKQRKRNRRKQTV